MTSSRSKNERKAQVQRRKQASRRKSVLWAVAGGLGIFVAWLVFSNPLSAINEQPVAEPAPDITLMTQQGEYRLSEQKGEIVALYFAFAG